MQLRTMPTTARNTLKSSARFSLVVLTCAALLFGPHACCRPTSPPLVAQPLVIIGVDGLEWRLVVDLVAEGKLPELASMMREGSYGRLRTLEPALSPRLWTSMATGVLPERHGILGFVRPDKKDSDGQPILFTNDDRRTKALWNIADDAGLRSCVVGYWMTSPVEPIRGVMVAQTATPSRAARRENAPSDASATRAAWQSASEHDPAKAIAKTAATAAETATGPAFHPAPRPRKGGLLLGVSGQVHPKEMEPQVFAAVRASRHRIAQREQQIFGDASAWPPAMQRLVEHSRWSIAADAAYQRIALDLMSESDRCDVMLVYLGLPDVLGHRFWRWTYPEDFSTPPSAEERATYGSVLRNAYQQVDAFVGEMRRKAGEQATIVVLSDHGMGAFRPSATWDLTRADSPLVRTGGHSSARDALLVAAGPGIARSNSVPPRRRKNVARVGSILDTTPTLLTLLGLAVGQDMDGHALESLLDPEFRAAHSTKRVATHTPANWLQTRPRGGSSDSSSPQRIDQLRGLGYLE